MNGATVYGIDALPNVGPAAVCMGVFDGVHRGHRALLAATRAAAATHGARSVALVFHPHPDEVIRPGTVTPRLAPLDANLRMIGDAGVDIVLPVRFDGALRALTPEAFLGEMSPALHLRALVMTSESAFGRGRAGTPDAMRAHGRLAGFDLVLADGLVTDGGLPISSARIREVLTAGAIDEAAELLGHPPYLEGTLGTAGEELPLGTLRLTLSYRPALPPVGPYRAELRVAARRRPAKLIVGSDGTVIVAPEGPGEGGDLTRQAVAIDLLGHLAS